MSEQNKAIARRLFEDVLNRRQLEALNEIFAEDTLFGGNHLPEVRGPEAIKEFVSGVFSAFPDIEYTLHSVIGDGDEVAVRWTGKGTQKGAWMGAAATGKQMTVNGTTTLRFADQKIAEHWVDWDLLGQMKQLGLSPSILSE